MALVSHQEPNLGVTVNRKCFNWWLNTAMIKNYVSLHLSKLKTKVIYIKNPPPSYITIIYTLKVTYMYETCMK